MRAAQLFNLLPASIMNIKNWIAIYICFIAELDRVLERYPDTPPVPGYTSIERKFSTELDKDEPDAGAPCLSDQTLLDVCCSTCRLLPRLCFSSNCSGKYATAL